MRPNRSPQGPEQAVVLALSITAAVRTTLWTRGLPMAAYVEKRGE